MATTTSTHYSPSATPQSKVVSSVAPSSPLLASIHKKKTMSITQTYFLAHKARAKLSSEAARPDHNLRLLVGHANLLDSLMLELADAEREQESWFNQSVRGATKSEDRHIQWADQIVEDPEEDWRAEDADSDSDSSDSDSDFDEDEEDVEMADAMSLTRVASHSSTMVQYQADEDELDDEEDYATLTLTRSPSHSAASPPELDDDSDSSEDESMPPSPPSTNLPTFAENQNESPSLFEPSQQDNQKSFYDEGYYLPPRNPSRLVSSISVY